MAESIISIILSAVDFYLIFPLFVSSFFDFLFVSRYGERQSSKRHTFSNKDQTTCTEREFVCYDFTPLTPCCNLRSLLSRVTHSPSRSSPAIQQNVLLAISSDCVRCHPANVVRSHSATAVVSLPLQFPRFSLCFPFL